MHKTYRKYIVYLITLVTLVPLFGVWWHASGALLTTAPRDFYLAFGRLTGLLAVYTALIQFVLMSRAPWLEGVFGMDVLSRFHKKNGYVTFLLILIHPLLITLSYAGFAHVSLFAQFMDFLHNYEDAGAAAISVLLFILVVGSSITIARKRLRYESWYFVHLLTYLAIVLAFGHQLSLGGDFDAQPLAVAYWYALYAFAFGNLILFRSILPLYHSWHREYRVARLVQETGDTVSVYISTKEGSLMKAKPGQFVIVRFLAKGLWWQAHPFSLSSMPTKEGIRITVKQLGDFTKQLSSLAPGTRLLLEGPYGGFTPVEDPRAKYLFIAGGVGITPVRSMIEMLYQTNDLVLLYGSRTSSDIIFKQELEAYATSHHFPLYNVYSNEEAAVGKEVGRVDAEKIKRLVPDFLEREMYLCGPPPMMNGAEAALLSLNVKPEKIHAERFAF